MVSNALSPRITAAHAACAPVVPLLRSDIPKDTVLLARYLLGKILVREWRGGRIAGRIVETEAYPPGDPASHAYRGMTRRNRSVFLDAGHAYVYLCYGTSHLLNVSSEDCGTGAGVLLRALEPLAGIAAMRRGRTALPVRDLARGPGRLSAALRVNLALDGIDLLAPGSLWIGTDGGRGAEIRDSTRIGLTKAADARLRFFLSGHANVSGPRRLNDGLARATRTRT